MRTWWAVLSVVVLSGYAGSAVPVFGDQIMMQGIPTRTSPQLIDLTNRIQANPSVADLKNRASEYQRLGLPKEAVDDLDKAISIEPQDAIARLLKAEVYYNSGMYPETISWCNDALNVDPKFVGAIVLRTRARLKMKDYSKALTEAESLFALAPNSAEPFLLRGAAYEGLAKYDEAIKDLTASIAADPKLAKAYYFRGQAYQETAQYDKAVADFSQAIELEPTFRPAFLARAWTYDKMGKQALAIRDCSRAINFDNTDMLHALNKFVGEKTTLATINPDPEYKWGLEIEDELKDAVSLYDDVLKTKPGDADTLRDRGLAYMHLSRYKDAIRDFDAANTGLPVNPTDFSGLGSQADYESAKDEYKAGNQEISNGNYQASLVHYRAALQKYPAYARAWHNMAIAYGALGDFFSAELCCIHALSYRPDDWKLWNTFGYSMFHEYQRDKGDPNKLNDAAAALRQSLALKPDSESDRDDVKKTLASVKSYQRSLAPTSNFVITTMPLI